MDVGYNFLFWSRRKLRHTETHSYKSALTKLANELAVISNYCFVFWLKTAANHEETTATRAEFHHLFTFLSHDWLQVQTLALFETPDRCCSSLPICFRFITSHFALYCSFTSNIFTSVSKCHCSQLTNQKIRISCVSRALRVVCPGAAG